MCGVLFSVFVLISFLKRKKGSKVNLQLPLSILGTVKTCFLHFICKEKHGRSECTREHPQFLQETRQWCWIPGRIEEGGCCSASFPPYLFLISSTLSSSPSSLFFSSLIFPFGFESFHFTPFIHFLTADEKTVTPFREIYFGKDWKTQPKELTFNSEVLAWAGRIFMSRKSSRVFCVYNDLFSIYGMEMMDVQSEPGAAVRQTDGQMVSLVFWGLCLGGKGTDKHRIWWFQYNSVIAFLETWTMTVLIQSDMRRTMEIAISLVSETLRKRIC